MNQGEKYKKLLEDAAWNADSDLDYNINFKDEAPNEVILTRGRISIEDKSYKTKFTYKFAIGVDGNILFSECARSKETEKGYLVCIDLRKRMHNDIITFNENLAIGIGAKRIVVNDEESERVRNLYFSRGYTVNMVNNIPQSLEKILK